MTRTVRTMPPIRSLPAVAGISGLGGVPGAGRRGRQVDQLLAVAGLQTNANTTAMM